MKKAENPFDELYVSETIPPREYVRLFSPALVDQAQALFRPANVILEGQQGSGKTMLLSLFKPAVRMAYEEASEEFPVSGADSNFIAAGINLRKSPAIDFGQRDIEGVGDEGLPLYFGDFLNYWIIYDLLASIEQYAKPAAESVRRRLSIDLNVEALDEFAAEASSLSLWFGYLEGAASFARLQRRIAERIQHYKAFLNFNIDQLPDEVRSSKSPIGTAISEVVKTGRRVGVFGAELKVFIRIDQYEELMHLQDLQSGDLGRRYSGIVNKALALRDPEVFYRIGARSYAWQDEELSIHGTGAVLEEERDFTVVDLDSILQRTENPATWIFPDFAEDVFRRRLYGSEVYHSSRVPGKEIGEVFGEGLSAEEEAKRYAGTAPSRVISSEAGWPENWRTFLDDLAEENPLSAKLGEAWARQRRGRRLKHEDPPSKPYPWEDAESWRKERIKQALTQIAYLCNERRIWGGRKDILTLSGGNILVFVSLCRHVWASWLRATRGDEVMNELPTIDVNTQSVGLQIASRYWFNKIQEWSGGATRQRFVTFLGVEFRRTLVKDKSMSYPGHNGFSVVREELENAPGPVRDFLADAVNYGDLQYREHSSKKKRDRRERVKFYLKPILSPHFQIPATHVKEPVYITIQELTERIEQARWGEGPDPPIRFQQAGGPDEVPPDEQLSLLD